MLTINSAIEFMPPKVKTDAEKLAIRTVIIDAARDLFIHHGVDAVTMRGVANKIGYSATSIYLYFSDKEQLLRAVVDADALKLAQALHSTLAISDPLERFLQFAQHYVQFALANPNHYRMMFMTPHLPCDPALSSIEQHNPEQDGYAQLIGVATSACAAGIFKDEFNHPVLLAQTVWASMHGLCALQINMADDAWINWQPIEARIDFMMRMCLQGLLKVTPHE
ncbi:MULTISPECIES: TetR/AcrR family transcriptional regulator [unclassified Methylophilus]|jgi:AcrR family transcriptional regulator|uniref:TetR/AcrR family transcriptional regulator n=2 Tax=unclassified Methylophilus TaxID=2630143 RepID=UPI001F3E2E03|nr:MULTISPECIES: TetR/AcrR family transcriptional regulator [unclassified Methylophilus]